MIDINTLSAKTRIFFYKNMFIYIYNVLKLKIIFWKKTISKMFKALIDSKFSIY